MRMRLACLLAAATGFVALSYEILWVRIHAFATEGRAGSFGKLLGAYLLGIALGSFLARRWCAAGDRPMRALGRFVLLANLLGFLLVPAVAALARVASPSLALPLIGLVAALLGTNLPLIAHFAIPADAEAGARLARVYLANIAGSAAGSLLTGFLFLDLWAIGTIALLLAALGVTLAAGIAAIGSPRRAGRLLAAGGVALALLAWMRPYDGVYEKLQLKGAYRAGYRFLELIENRSGVICVDREERVYGGGAYDGKFTIDPVDDGNGIVRAYALAALHPAPKRVLMVGLGSGAWAQVVANHPGLERLLIVEINPGYVELVRRWPLVASLLANPKVEIVIDDGRRWLHRHTETFDAIVQNTTHHWRAHATNLLSREYLEMVRAHLAPGGITYLNATGADAVARTALAVFPNVRRLRNFLAAGDAPLHVEAAAVRSQLEAWTIDGARMLDPARPECRARIDEILGAGDWEGKPSLEARTRASPVITDDNMATEWGR
ncbi:MAG: methyltransferase domain-containing protein [Planctomycetaceae bacterium]